MPFHTTRPLPGGAILGLWHLTEAPAELWLQLAAPAAYAPLLPARADGPRQAQWLAGRLLVQYLLRQMVPGQSLPTLQNDETGRPFLAGETSAPAVSLSHSGEWVAAVLAPPGTAAGIDVELVRDKAQRLASKFLTTEELAVTEYFTYSKNSFLASPDELFSLLWSAKETLYKLAGRRGIIFRQNLLLDLPLSPWPAAGTLPARLFLDECNSRHQICYLQPAAGYVLTYCLSHSTF